MRMQHGQGWTQVPQGDDVYLKHSNYLAQEAGLNHDLVKGHDFGSAVEGDCSFYNETLAPEKPLWRQPDFQGFQHVTVLAFPPWPVSTTSLQQHWERSKIPFYMPLSPEKFAHSWEPCALKHLGPSHLNSIACQNKPQLCHGRHWVCGYSSALDYTLLPNHRLQSPGCWCSALPCHLHLLLFGIPWGHSSSDLLSLVPHVTRTGQAQICAVTQGTGWKVRSSPGSHLDRGL